MDQRQAPAPALVETAPELEAGNAAMAEEASVEVAATPQEIATPILDQVAANLESGGEGGGGDGEDALVAGAYLELIPESITKAEAPAEVGARAKQALEVGEAPGSQPVMDVSQDPPGFPSQDGESGRRSSDTGNPCRERARPRRRGRIRGELRRCARRPRS